MDWKEVIFGLICPVLGGLVATSMFASPIEDLKEALQEQSLGDLNPRPWAIMTGNCLGWCAYAYYTTDPFVLAANLPGLVLCLWLNAGAAKLQYRQFTRQATTGRKITSSRTNGYTKANLDTGTGNYFEDETSDLTAVPVDLLNFTPQEVLWLRVLMVWSVALVIVGWLLPLQWKVNNPSGQANLIGLLVNLNLILLYAAPLQTMTQVIQSGSSNSIHLPTTMRSIVNALFWMLYGVALLDPIVILPNAIGLFLGLGQAFLCMTYPRKDASSPVPLTAGNGSRPTLNLEVSGVSSGFQDEFE